MMVKRSFLQRETAVGLLTVLLLLSTASLSVYGSHENQLEQPIPIIPHTGSYPPVQIENNQKSILSLQDGLIAHWEFDEMNGTVLNDSSSSGYNGAIQGAAWQNGYTGGALDFDGQDDLVEVQSAGSKMLTQMGSLDVGSITVWFQYETRPDNGISPILYFGQGNPSGQPNEFVIIEIGHGKSSNQRLYFTISSGGGIPLCFDSALNLLPNTWYHFTAVVGPNFNTGYLNGEEMTQRHYNFGNASGSKFFSAVSNPTKMVIGHGQFAIGKEWFHHDGLVDEIRIYDRALNSAEVQKIFQGQQSDSTFADVPISHPYYDEIESLHSAGYTAGCGTDPLIYCPDETMDRAESAVFVGRGLHGADYTPEDSAQQTFADLPLDSWAAKWAQSLWSDGLTSGCIADPLAYCPWEGHTRAEGVVFYLRMLHGSDFEPGGASGIFTDVSTEMWYARWAEAAFNAGLIPACSSSPLQFCPDAPLDRGLAAYMMVQAKELK
jgi:hypothetical protein